MVWRNKPKEHVRGRQERGERVSEKELEKLDAPDVLLACEKQRNGDFEGRISLWFNAGALQYCADSHCRPSELIE